MSAVPKRKLTEAEYLAIEKDADCKSEFQDGDMWAMAGVSRQHNTIQANLGTELGIRLKGGQCRPYTSDMRVKVKATGLYTYPDFMIVCGPAEIEKIQGVDTILNPQIVFEVLSETTEVWDRGLKFQNYQRVLTLKEYVLIDQRRVRVDHYLRQSDNTWERETTFNIADDLALVSLPLRLPLVDIYRNVEPLEPPPSST